ncbi:MAG: hypothetical protein AB1696_13475 [Planctomycetota bacterium]
MKKAMLFGLILAGVMMAAGVASAQDVWVTSRSTYSYPGASYDYTRVTTTYSYPVAPPPVYYYPETYTRVTYGPGYRSSVTYTPDATYVDYRSNVTIRSYSFINW